MGTYYNRNHTIPEASTDASVSHFSWFHPGSFFSAPKTRTRPPPGTQFNPEPCFPVPPICSVSPEAEPSRNNISGTKPSNATKQKNSVGDSNQISSKTLKRKQPKKSVAKMKKKKSIDEAQHEKKNLNIEIDRISFDLSEVPSPFCSCTGTPRVCYKWGAGGWQSSCCNISISEYPLPMSSTRPRARVAGRKMSNGAYAKLLLKLASEGHDFTRAVDLKYHWARHGTNKFVTIK